jgi:hypothetical protein
MPPRQKFDRSPAARAYAQAILDRAAALGYPACELGESAARGYPVVQKITKVRAAVVRAVCHAGVSPHIFRDIAATRADAGTFRDVYYRREVVDGEVERLIAALTAGMPPYVPEPEPEPEPEPALPALLPGGRFHTLPPCAFQDDPAAVIADAAGPRFIQPPTWVPRSD